jgi:hypothetical protein
MGEAIPFRGERTAKSARVIRRTEHNADIHAGREEFREEFRSSLRK